MNVEEQLIELVKIVSDIVPKVDTIQKAVDGVPQLLQKHDTRLDQIENSLQRGNQKFDKIDTRFDKVDARIDKLEQADGDKAKNVLRTIGNYLLVAIAGAILANIPDIVNALGGK